MGELSPERVKRIAHIKSHLDVGFKLDQLVRNIENGLGNPRACVMSLSRHAEASGFYAWFEERDLTSAMRQWFHTAAKLDRKWHQMEEDKQGFGSNTLRLIKPLVSNDRSLIEWFAHYDQVYYLDRVEEQTTHDFWAYQAIVALRGEWPRLYRALREGHAGPVACGPRSKCICRITDSIPRAGPSRCRNDDRSVAVIQTRNAQDGQGAQRR